MTIIKEFRVVLPISVEEYAVGKLYTVAEASKMVTGGGEGVQVLVNEPYEADGEKGQYTHKMYTVKKDVPKILSMIMPKGSLVVHEKAWNMYPYTRTILTSEYMKNDFEMKIETWHRPDLGDADNVHGLDPDEWKNVEVVDVDIAEQLSTKADYKVDTDPATFRSAKTGRGPLGPDWRREIAETKDSAGTPHMCAYKLVTVNFKWRGIQSNVEAWFQRRQRRFLHLFNRQLFCWMDHWISLTMEDIRRLEDETQLDLAESIEKGDYRGLIGLGDD